MRVEGLYPMHVAEHPSWGELHKTADQQHCSVAELCVHGSRHAVEMSESTSEVQPVARKKLAALLPSRRGTRGSPSLQISSSDRFIASPIDSGMI